MKSLPLLITSLVLTIVLFDLVAYVVLNVPCK